MDQNNKDFLVSVCMITYNHENFIKEALQGILSQVVSFNVQVVILDDSSSDGTAKIIESFLIENFNFFSFEFQINKERIGVAKNFKKALELCKGRYVAICEGDDVWNDRKKITTQVSFLENRDDCIASFHDSHFYSEKSELIYGTVLNSNSKRKLKLTDFLSGNHTLTTQSVIFRKNFIKLPDQFFEVPNPDLLLFTYLAGMGDFHYHEDIGYALYRLHSSGYFSTQSRFKQTKGNKDTFLKISELYPNNEIVKRTILVKMNTTLVYALKEKKFIQGIKSIIEIFTFVSKDFLMIKEFLRLQKTTFNLFWKNTIVK